MSTKRPLYCFAIGLLFLTLSGNVSAQQFRSVVERSLKRDFNLTLLDVCPIDADSVSMRVFRDYGAVYVSKNAAKPPKCMFRSEEEVTEFQRQSGSETKTIGGTSVTLQKAAMKDLLAAVQEAVKQGLQITPRGGTEASTRSFGKTVDLWRSRFEPALAVYVRNGSVKSSDADKARRMPIHDQVAAVLAWEQRNLWFSTDRSKSILYSVAAPGASQHIFMLALDVAQFADPAVRRILASHGWFQTVKSDLPHFTYLGREAKDLPSLGLRPETVSGQQFWVPDL